MSNDLGNETMQKMYGDWEPKFPCNEDMDCQCYLPKEDGEECHSDECTEKGGMCMMKDAWDGTMQSSMYDWEPRFSCNENMDCQCYLPREEECENDQCTGNGGKCIMPGEQKPQGWEMRGYCNQEMQCKCFGPKTEECKNTQCTNVKKGTCVLAGETPPANSIAKGFCNKDMGCKCYVPQSDPEPADCKNEKCEQIFGVCVQKGQSVASDLASLYQPATGNVAFCDKESECKCYKPKCKRTNKCKAAKGQCFSNKIVPSGWNLVKKKGKNIVCNKGLKCYCYKQGGKSARSLDNDLDLEEDLEDGPDDYLESEEDFDDDFEFEEDDNNE